MDILTHPIAVLVYIVVALAIVIPWLKKRAANTKTPVDDSILDYLGIILSQIAQGLMARLTKLKLPFL